MLFRSLLLLIAVLVVGACGTDEPAGLEGFDTSTITIDERELYVAVAQTPVERSQGLMGVTDIGGLDGMLFVFQAESNGGFWMKDTLIPLDIAFFDSDGGLVNVLTMEPCVADPCPSYLPGGPYRYAVEAPAGDLGFVVSTSRLEIDG